MAKGKSGFQAVNREWCQQWPCRKFAEAADLSLAESAMHLALLNNLMMDKCRDGDIAPFSTTWVENQCLWEGDPGEMLKGLYNAGLLELDEKGRPAKILHLDALIGERLADLDKKAKAMREWRTGHSSTLDSSTQHTPTPTENNRIIEREIQRVKEKRSESQSTSQSQSIERSDDEETTLELCNDYNDEDVILLQSFLYSNQIKISTADLFAMMKEGFEKDVILWMTGKVCDNHPDSPKSYFMAIVEDLRDRGVISLEKLRESECDSFGAELGFNHHISLWRDQFKRYKDVKNQGLQLI